MWGNGPARHEMPAGPSIVFEMEFETNEIGLTLCGVVLRFFSKIRLRVNGGIDAFITSMPPDVTVNVEKGSLNFPDRLRGDDAVMRYAAEGKYLLTAGKPPVGSSGVVVRYHSDFSNVNVLLDVDRCGRDVRQIVRILQCFPMRELLARYDAVLLHSSRVEADGRAIVFSAPSGVGKTTQARLWEQYAGARIVSNDRTIVRRIDGRFVTSGFPVDGSEPVLDPAIIPLGAVVLLRQGTENSAERLPAGRALALLMEQTSVHRWDGAGISQAMLFWSDLLAEYPAILLTCRPDKGAVRCLQAALKEGR